MKEELNKIKNSSMFSGVTLRTDEYFNFDPLKNFELKHFIHTRDSSKNTELREVLDKERKGYSKSEMTKKEIENERKIFT